MFQSEPICILQAGTTVDGRVIEQKIIDEIAETYNPEVYTARINEEHYDWSYKFGSVLSVEKREDKLFAIIKPNSHLLRMTEQGQLLHTSCEFIEKFSDTEKAYLTGLALTDKPASLGTTQFRLSSKDDGKVRVLSDFTIKPQTDADEAAESDASLFQTFKSWLSGQKPPEPSTQQEEPSAMSKETEELLKQSLEQNKELSTHLSLLVESLAAQQQPEAEPESDPLGDLKGQVEQLSTQMTEMATTLSQITDETPRKLAGEDSEEEPYL